MGVSWRVTCDVHSVICYLVVLVFMSLHSLSHSSISSSWLLYPVAGCGACTHSYFLTVNLSCTVHVLLISLVIWFWSFYLPSQNIHCEQLILETTSARFLCSFSLIGDGVIRCLTESVLRVITYQLSHYHASWFNCFTHLFTHEAINTI